MRRPFPTTLVELGWGEPYASAFASLGDSGLVAARVVAAHRGEVRIAGEFGESRASLSGRLQRDAENALDLPTVGDWVAVRRANPVDVVEVLLPRRGAVVRKAAGEASLPQLLAANIDVAVIVMGLDGDYNERRLERFLIAAREANAEIIVILSKADVVPDHDLQHQIIAAISAPAPVAAGDLRTDDMPPSLVRALQPGRTLALFGSSGAGKSTLINRLAGFDVQKTAVTREKDHRGKHTTTHREMFVVEGGALVIDSPGIRELELWEPAGLTALAFTEIEALALQCRFSDCRHQSEPGCAVTAAVESGEISGDRYVAWQRLRGEAEAAEARSSTTAALRLKAYERAQTKALNRWLDQKRGD